MALETLRFEVDGGVARVTLRRPEAANAMNLAMTRELLEVALRCDGDPAIRAVLLDAEGKLFCAGGDLEAFAEAAEGAPALLKEMTAHLHAAIARFARMDPPLVIAVQGTAAGAGASLLCTGDLVLAARSARITLAYTRAGLAPDGSSTFYLARLVGLRRAQELLFTNRVLSAEEALRLGLVTRVVDDEALAEEAMRLARELAAGPTRTFGAVKRLLLEGASAPLEEQLERESRAIADASRTEDGREGVRAFLEKRAPRFRGC